MSGLPPRTDVPTFAEIEEEAKELFKTGYFDALLFSKTGLHLKAVSEATKAKPKSAHEAKLQAYIKKCVKDAITRRDL